MELASAVKEYKNGNKEAFQDIYEESNRYIYACISKVLSGNDNAQDMISDVMQDTYMEISQSIGQLDNCDKFLSWAGMIATRKCYAIVSKNKKYVLSNEEESFDDIPDDTSLIPEEVMDDKEKQKIIRDIIDKELTPMQKLCIVAYYYNEQKQGDIARELNIPENTVKTNLSRAKQKIKEAVLGIEKKDGTKLYSIAPFMLLLFKDEIGNAVVPGAVSNSILGAGAVTKGTSAVLTTGAKVATMTLKAKIIAASIAVGVVALVGGGVAVASIIAQEPEQIEEETHKDKKDKKDKDDKKIADFDDSDEEEIEEVDEVVDPDAWKAPYIEKVQEWQEAHGADDNIGYDLVYIDDDDVPELYLSCDCSYGGFSNNYLYASSNGELVELLAIEDMMMFTVSYYEGSGIYFTSYSGAYNYEYGHYWKDGKILDDVTYTETTYAFDENGDWVSVGTGWYRDENGNIIDVSYSGESGEGNIISLFPNVDEIISLYNIKDINDLKYLYAMDSMTYDEICEILGITDKVSPNPNGYYKKLLTDWKNGVSNGSFTQDMGAWSSDNMDYKQFAYADINGDNVNELIVGDAECFNILLPVNTWEEASCGSFTSIDGNGILVRAEGYTFGVDLYFYSYDGSSVTEIGSCGYFDGSDLDGSGISCTVFGQSVSEDEYSATLSSYNLHDLSDIEWYEVTDDNINAIFN